MQMPHAFPMSMVWTGQPGQTWLGSASAFLLMWMLMTMFMMSPSLFQALRSVRKIKGIFEVALGYSFVWLLLGSGVFVLGVGVADVLTWSPVLAGSIPVVGAVSILCAGVIQSTLWKRRRLMRCRALPGVLASVPFAVLETRSLPGTRLRAVLLWLHTGHGRLGTNGSQGDGNCRRGGHRGALCASAAPCGAHQRDVSGLCWGFLACSDIGRGLTRDTDEDS
jgi:hypothetical protein